MPVVFGETVNSVEAIVAAFRRHGDDVRGTYRAHYRFGRDSVDPYSGVRLERPASLVNNPPDVTYPWEQVFVAAAACAGSDYPMLAAHLGIAIDSISFVVEGDFDPRDEFDGLDGFAAPAESRHCFLSLHLRTTLVSTEAPDVLARLHERVLANNMVLGALRGIPTTNELQIETPAVAAAAG